MWATVRMSQQAGAPQRTSGIPEPPDSYPNGLGLRLLPWDGELMRQMGDWQARGFPFHGFDMTHLRDPAAAQAHLKRLQSDRRHLHFVACEGDRAVGRVAVNLQDRAGLYIWAVHVPPDHERRGVCRRMLRVLVDWLRARHPGRPIVLTTNTFSKAAHHAYRAVGFVTIEKRWQYDDSIARALSRGPRDYYRLIAPHVRFFNGQWEVQTLLMRYAPPAAEDGPTSAAGQDEMPSRRSFSSQA